MKLTYLINQVFFPAWIKIQGRDLNMLSTRKTFKVKQKAFFIIFKGLSLEQIKWIFLEGESPILVRCSKFNTKSQDICKSWDVSITYSNVTFTKLIPKKIRKTHLRLAFLKKHEKLWTELTETSKFQKQSSGGVLWKGVLKGLAKSIGKHLCWSRFFNKVAGLRSTTLSKKRLGHRRFPSTSGGCFLY